MLKKIFKKKTNSQAFKLISEYIDQVILLTDKKGKITYATKSTERILGYKNRELIGKNLSNFIYQENFPLIQELYSTCIEKGDCSQRYWFQLKEGNYRQFLMKNKYISKERKILCILTLPEKFTFPEQELHLQDRKYTFLLNNMTDCIIVISEAGYIIHANGMEEFLGYKDEDIIGSTAFIPVHPDDRQKTLDVFNEFIKKGELTTSKLDYRLKNAKGEYIWVEANFRVIQDLETGEYQILNNLRDITERKKMEKKLIEYNSTKDKLFSIIAHDLKNPISNLTGFARLLKTDYYNETEEEIKESINRIYESSKLINELMENLLNWSRTQYKRITAEPEKISAKEAFNQTLSYFEEILKNKEIVVNPNFNTENQAFADKNMLQTIFRNLLSNAIKFSHPKSSINIGNQSVNDSYEIIFVEDHGVGLSEDEQNKILDDNQFISSYGTENEKGVGLGLKIIKEFVRKNNGEIWFEKNRKTGTKVYIKLPKS